MNKQSQTPMFDATDEIAEVDMGSGRTTPGGFDDVLFLGMAILRQSLGMWYRKRLDDYKTIIQDYLLYLTPQMRADWQQRISNEGIPAKKTLKAEATAYALFARIHAMTVSEKMSVHRKHHFAPDIETLNTCDYNLRYASDISAHYNVMKTAAPGKVGSAMMQIMLTMGVEPDMVDYLVQHEQVLFGDFVYAGQGEGSVHTRVNAATLGALAAMHELDPKGTLIVYGDTIFADHSKETDVLAAYGLYGQYTTPFGDDLVGRIIPGMCVDDLFVVDNDGAIGFVINPYKVQDVIAEVSELVSQSPTSSDEMITFDRNKMSEAKAKMAQIVATCKLSDTRVAEAEAIHSLFMYDQEASANTGFTFHDYYSDKNTIENTIAATQWVTTRLTLQHRVFDPVIWNTVFDRVHILGQHVSSRLKYYNRYMMRRRVDPAARIQSDKIDSTIKGIIENTGWD